MKLKVKRLTPSAKLPTKAYDTDSGYDIYAQTVVDMEDNGIPQFKVFTGIAVQPESGYYTEVVPRSSINKKYLQLANSVGIIDETYTGEIILHFNKLFIPDLQSFPVDQTIKFGEKIAQLIIRKRYEAEIEEVSELTDTQRGSKGFGSSGV
jgi:dUTP pyrophosphatase